MGQGYRSEWKRGRAALPALALAGCASFAPGSLPPGTPIAQARDALFRPSAEYALPGGGTRLEFPQGQFGKQTYMLDFDNSGSLVSSEQVLTERNLASAQKGMTAQQVRERYGRPAAIFGVRFAVPASVWNYRYAGGDCVWYQISISEESHRVTESNVGSDPVCEKGNVNGRN